MKNKYYWAIGIFTIFVLLFSAYANFVFRLGGGGGANHEVPDTVISGEPAVITVTLSTWGGGGAIAGRYTNVSLGYRRTGESEYQVLQPEFAPLAVNYRDAMARDKRSQYEAYRFTIPPYPKGTTGEIEYYLDTTLDEHQSHQEGIKKIKLVTAGDVVPFTQDPEYFVAGAHIEIVGMVTGNEVKIDAPSQLHVMLASKWSEDRVIAVTYGGDHCENATPDAYNLKYGDGVRIRGVVISAQTASVCGSTQYAITPIVGTSVDGASTTINMQ